jgi:hypothetical protein
VRNNSIAAGIAVITVASVGIGATTQRHPPRPSAPVNDGAAIRTVSPDAGRSEPGKKSDTDYWFDSQTVRLTAR